MSLLPLYSPHSPPDDRLPNGCMSVCLSLIFLWGLLSQPSPHTIPKKYDYDYDYDYDVRFL